MSLPPEWYCETCIPTHERRDHLDDTGPCRTGSCPCGKFKPMRERAPSPASTEALTRLAREAAQRVTR